MSYDVTFCYLQPYPDELWRNYTSNVSPMWTAAIGRPLGDLIDEAQTNADLIGWLKLGVARMEDEPETYRAMNPENGWGDYDGALGYLRWMLSMCEAVPGGTVSVSR